jgi:hypothetical protein
MDQGDIRYTDLVPGQRYTISLRNPLPSELDDPQQPFNGEYVRYDPDGQLAIFRDVIANNGDTDNIDDPSWSHWDPDSTVFSIGPPVVMQQPPRPWPQRNIPPDTDDVVYAMPITEGMDMVDFHGEYGYGRYYPLEVYNALAVPKENPMTRQTILPADVQYYTAHISAPIGGRRRRKTKKSKRRVRKSRRRQY